MHPAELHQFFDLNPGQRVFGYCRVSSTKQEQGLSLEAQRDAIRDYCRAGGLADPYIVQETASAGRRMFDLGKVLPSQQQAAEAEDPLHPSRPLLEVLLGHMTGVTNCDLIVWRMDRFSRLTDEREILHQLLLRSRCRLHSTDASEQSYLTGDGGDPMQALIRQVFGAFSQYERAVIEVRMKAGMRMKASKGGFTGGRIPYGYRVRGGELEPDPEQLRMVRWVYCARHTKGMSIRQMEAHLMAHGHPDMSRSRIHRILQNEPLYRGVYTDRFGASHTRDDLRILDLGTDYDYPEFAE